MASKKKTILLTGASSGIGLAMAMEFARKGADLIMVSRDAGRGEAACVSVRKATGASTVRFLPADLGSLASIRTLCHTLDGMIDRLDVLANNAGICHREFVLSRDGIEETYAVNHLAVFLLTRLLMDKLLAADASRIVNTSSSAHMFARIDWEGMNDPARYNGWNAYRGSKLANLLFTQALAPRLASTPVTVNCFHPGTVATRVFDNIPPVLNIINRLTFVPAEDAASTGVYLSLSDEVKGKNGQYYGRMRIRPTFILPDKNHDPDYFWHKSEALTGAAWPKRF